MATRVYTNFLVQDDDSYEDQKKRYFTDVQEDYDTVFERVYPLQAPISTLEARSVYGYTKTDGGRIALHPSQIISFEELMDE